MHALLIITVVPSLGLFFEWNEYLATVNLNQFHRIVISGGDLN